MARRTKIEMQRDIDKATKALARAERLAIAALRKILSSRHSKCDPKCKGYMVNGERNDIERCDECASLNGYGGVVHDDLCSLLPVARRDLGTDLAD